MTDEEIRRNQLRTNITEQLIQSELPKDDILEELMAAAATAVLVFEVCTEQEAVHKLELYMQNARQALQSVGSRVHWHTGEAPEA